MKEHSINNLDNFIMGWYQEDHSILDKILDYYRSADKEPGRIYGPDGERKIEKSMKDSLDCYLIPGSDLFQEYCGIYLQSCADEYIKKYPRCNMQNPWTVTNNINIQYYPPGGGFHKWHTERFSCDLPVAATHLVFMTYLSTVTDGGETEFYHQKIKIKPEKGLTLIWPSDWTFTHRGNTSLTEEKYIVTGWYHYIS